MSWISEPLQQTFMVHAFLAIILVGIICGATGVFVTLRGLAFLGDALSHAIFPGIVIAFIFGGHFLIGALIAALIVSMGIGFVSQNGRLSNDTAIGILFVGSFAFGIALMSTQQGYTRDLTSFLLGSILGVTTQDLALTALIGVIVLMTIFWFRRELTIVAFDRTFAQASGINVWLLDMIFLLILALAIVTSLQTVGNILVLAMLVTPAATARLLTDRLPVMVVLSSLLGAISGVVGLYLSYYQGISSGACVVLVTTALFGLVFLFAPRTGVITARVARRLHYGHPERDTFTLRPDDDGRSRQPL